MLFPKVSSETVNASEAIASLIHERDWSTTHLGDPDSWPASMKAIFALMLDSRFPMFLAWGDDLTFLYNDAYVEMLGDKHPDAFGARFQDVWQEIWTDISPLVDRALAGEATWIENHHLKVHRHGYIEDAWFTFSYSPARDDEGRVAGMFCAVTETTGRVLAEASLRELNQTLEARVEERSSQLRATEDQLRQSQRFEAIGQLTGGIAHDFNNLLTVIRGSVDLLRRNNLADDKRHRYLDAIGSTADRAAKLTSQMLAFARRQTLKPEAFDARTALEETADMIGSVTGPNIVFALQTPNDTCCILADRGQFETAIINMILNARDAMSGAGKLTLVVSPKASIPSSPPVEGDFIAIAITDTGIGIPEDKLDRIFEPFFTTKAVGSGTGLGLSQAIGFAKQSGGDLRVSSVEGLGTSFTLYLPRADNEQMKPISATAMIRQPIEGKGRRVLVVEDNEHVGDFAVQALQELGFETVFAADAERALAELAADAGRFDIVFSDVVMPGMSGIELAIEVGRLYPGIPIILASGYSDALAQGGTQGFKLLRKPYSVEELAVKLTKALAGGLPAPIIVEIVDAQQLSQPDQ